MTRHRRRWPSLLALGLLLSAFWWMPWAVRHVGLGVDWQRQPSNRFRVYLHLKTQTVCHRGDYVPFSVQGLAPLVPDGTLFVKRLAGVAGDRIEIRQRELLINDRSVATINPVILAKAGLAQSRLSEYSVIPDGQVLLLGTTASSFDSRYFGLVSTDQLRGQAWPIW